MTHLNKYNDEIKKKIVSYLFIFFQIFKIYIFF